MEKWNYFDQKIESLGELKNDNGFRVIGRIIESN